MNSDKKVVNYKDKISFSSTRLIYNLFTSEVIWKFQKFKIWIQRTYNDILKYKTLSNTKIYNYKVLNLVELYNFSIELIYIRDKLINWYFNLNVYHIILFNS